MQHASSVPFGTQVSTARKNRAVSVAIVGAVHVALIYGLLGIFGVVPAPKVKDYIDLTVISPDKPPVDDRVKTDIKVDVQTRVAVPSPDEPVINIQSDRAITGVTPAGPGLQTSAPTGPQIIAYTRTIPPYPPVDVRLSHEGTVTLQLTIDASGTVTNAVVTRSSGFDTLDAAAVAWVKAKWHYKPATQNGTAVASTSLAAVKFELRNR